MLSSHSNDKMLANRDTDDLCHMTDQIHQNMVLLYVKLGTTDVEQVVFFFRWMNVQIVYEKLNMFCEKKNQLIEMFTFVVR